MLKIRNIIATLMLVSGLFVIMTCSAATAEPVDAKTVLEQRVVKYWSARQANDFRTVYELESGSLPNGGLTPDKAMAVSGLRVKNVKIEAITVDGDRAKVRLNGNVLVGAMGWVPQTLEDNWVLIDGQWYHETSR